MKMYQSPEDFFKSFAWLITAFAVLVGLSLMGSVLVKPSTSGNMAEFASVSDFGA